MIVRRSTKNLRLAEERIREQNRMINDLSVELTQLKQTIIRISAETPMGWRPLYQAELTYAILSTKLAGGRGIDAHPLMVEVGSKWSPPGIEPDDEPIDQLDMDEAATWHLVNTKTQQRVSTTDHGFMHDLMHDLAMEGWQTYYQREEEAQ